MYAAGNTGGPSYQVSVQGNCKICLTVGAGADIEDMASFSSVGPAYDDRIKPDIVAPGSDTVSANAQTQCGECSKFSVLLSAMNFMSILTSAFLLPALSIHILLIFSSSCPACMNILYTYNSIP